MISQTFGCIVVVTVMNPKNKGIYSTHSEINSTKKLRIEWFCTTDQMELSNVVSMNNWNSLQVKVQMHAV